VDTTTTTLPHRLHQALRTAGLTPYRASRVVNLLHPAGQHWLLGQLERDPQFTFTRLLAAFIGHVADQLRLPHHETRLVLKTFATAVTR
jgi:hypothetical protein